MPYGERIQQRLWQKLAEADIIKCAQQVVLEACDEAREEAIKKGDGSIYIDLLSRKKFLKNYGLQNFDSSSLSVTLVTVAYFCASSKLG